MQENSSSPEKQPIDTPTETPWYEKKIGVIFWVIVFFPIGLFGLWRSSRFHILAKIVITAVVAVVVTLHLLNEHQASVAGFESSADQQEAAELKITTASAYYQYKENKAKQRQLTIERETREREQAEFEKVDVSVGAYFACKEYTKKKLVSPASADFPFLPDDALKFKNQNYLITISVDSQNQFGAMLRSQVLCKVKFKGTSTKDADQYNINNWDLVELVFVPS